jgi:hypothetical protein
MELIQYAPQTNQVHPVPQLASPQMDPQACALLKVSPAAFHSHLTGPSQHEREDAGLAAEIQAVHADCRSACKIAISSRSTTDRYRPDRGLSMIGGIPPA